MMDTDDKKNHFTNGGFTVVEMVFTVLMVAILTTATSTVLLSTGKVNLNISKKSNISGIFLEVVSNVSDARDMLAIFEQPANFAVMNCRDDLTVDCPTGWNDLTVYEVMRDKVGSVIDFKVPDYTIGFREDGAACSGFSIPSGNPSCSLRYDFQWKANCIAPCRNPSSILVKAQLRFSPGPNTGNVHLDTEVFSIELPVVIPRTRIVSVDVDMITPCVVYDDGTAKCWGSNRSSVSLGGSLGANFSGVYSATPLWVRDFTGTKRMRGITKLIDGGGTKCILTTSKKVACWGENGVGQAGTGKFGSYAGGLGQDNYTHPVEWVKSPDGTMDLNDVEDIYPGNQTMCARTKVAGANKIYCWGEMFKFREAYACVPNQTVPGTWAENVTAMWPEGPGVGTYIYSLPTLLQPQSLTAIRSTYIYSTSRPAYEKAVVIDPGGCTMPSESEWTRFYKGYQLTCFLVGNPGKANCWGSGSFGALGATNLPGRMILMSKNYFIPQIGSKINFVPDPTDPTLRVLPAVVPPPLDNIVDLELRSPATPCALLATGEVVCWGGRQTWNNEGIGMIGDGDATNAIEIPPTYVKDFSGTGTLKNIKKISGSWTSLCALSMIGEVYCWGPNDYGQVGDPSLPVGTSALIPHKVALPGPAVQVAAGWSLNCALLANNNVYCWGRNILGAMGLDPVTGLRYPNAVYQTPVLVGGI